MKAPGSAIARKLSDPKHGFVFLFLSLIILILVTPIASLAAEKSGRHVFLLLHEIAFFAVLIAAVSAVSRRGPILFATLIYAVVVGSMRLGGFFSGSGQLAAAGEALAALFLAAIIAILLRKLFRPQRVSFNTIAASLSAYLIIAIWFAIMYMLLERLLPGSILHSDGTTAFDVGNRDVSAMYFSFVTITTLGYGDITPQNGPARTLASVEALLGQIYLVVLVARLVGLHIAETTVPQEDHGHDERDGTSDV